MAYHNPFIVNGKIRFPANTNLVKHVERWAKVRGGKLAYRFLDFSTERDGVERDISWSDFSARNRAVGARLQQVTQPGDRIAILCPQNLDYLVSFFGALYSGRIARRSSLAGSSIVDSVRRTSGCALRYASRTSRAA